jgi:hypothetical protein
MFPSLRTINPNSGLILVGLGMENVAIFFGHLEYFTTLLYILWSYGIFFGDLVYFLEVWYTYFVDVWYFLCRFGIFILGLVCYTKKNVATLVSGLRGRQEQHN